MTPQLTLACGIPDGKGRPHGRKLAHVQLQDGAPGVIGGEPGIAILTVTTPPGLILACPEHGGLMVTDDEMVARMVAPKSRLDRGALHVSTRSRLKIS